MLLEEKKNLSKCGHIIENYPLHWHSSVHFQNQDMNFQAILSSCHKFVS